MNNYKIITQVKRTPKPFSRVLKITMVVFAVLFVLMGIVISQGFMLPGFLLAALYFAYDIFSRKEYEYVLEDAELNIDVIYGKRYRRHVHEILMNQVEVVAPNLHEAVAKYRKGTGTEKLPKYDYTSYNDEIPYYTMIATEDHVKIKLLLDLDEEMLRAMKQICPDRVFYPSKKLS